MEKNTLELEQSKTDVSEKYQNICNTRTSKDQQLHSNETSSDNIQNQQLLEEQFSKKWAEFLGSINNLGCVLHKDVSETSIKYLTILTKKVQNIVTPTQAVDFVINNASR